MRGFSRLSTPLLALLPLRYSFQLSAAPPLLVSVSVSNSFPRVTNRAMSVSPSASVSVPESAAVPVRSKRLVRYAAEKNKQFILEVLAPRLEALRSSKGNNNNSNSTQENPATIKLLEIASGTGEHAAHFLGSIENVHYQPTEMDTTVHESIADWLCDFPLACPPVLLDVNDFAAQAKSNIVHPAFCPLENNVDVMICINMIHISPFSSTEKLFQLASQALQQNGFLLTYGPYRVGGSMVESNVKFDASLRERNPEWGVRNLEDVELAAQRAGMRVAESISMPANNMCIVFRKQ